MPLMPLGRRTRAGPMGKMGRGAIREGHRGASRSRSSIPSGWCERGTRATLRMGGRCRWGGCPLSGSGCVRRRGGVGGWRSEPQRSAADAGGRAFVRQRRGRDPVFSFAGPHPAPHAPLLSAARHLPPLWAAMGPRHRWPVAVLFLWPLEVLCCHTEEADRGGGGGCFNSFGSRRCSGLQGWLGLVSGGLPTADDEMPRGRLPAVPTPLPLVVDRMTPANGTPLPTHRHPHRCFGQRLPGHVETRHARWLFFF